MRNVIGIGISADRIRAVVLRSGAIRWAGECEISPGESIEIPLAQLLNDAQAPRKRRLAAAAAIGPSSAQTKRIAGLPHLNDAHAIERIVTESIARFFIQHSTPVVTSGVVPIAPGEVWAAAFAEPIVREIERACAVARLRLTCVLPTIAVLGKSLQEQELDWADGAVTEFVEFEDGRLRKTKRARTVTATGRDIRPVEMLSKLGDRGVAYADAFGAAVCAFDSSVPAWRPSSHSMQVGPAWRFKLAGALCGIAIGLAVVAPIVSAVRSEKHARTRLAMYAEQYSDATQAQRNLAAVTDAILDAGRFEQRRYSFTILLADLTRAMPAKTAITTLRIDSTASADLVLVSEGQIATVLRELEKVPGLVGLEIVGPVTKEIIEGGSLHRATIRFRIDVASRRKPGNVPAGANT